MEDAEPLRVRIVPTGQLRQESDLLIDQLRAIDNRRLVDGPLAQLPANLLRRVNRAIEETLDLNAS